MSYFLTILTALSFRYRPQPSPSARWSFSKIYAAWKEFAKKSRRRNQITRYRCATILIAWRTGAICYSLLLLSTIPILVCVAVARAHFDGARGAGYEAHLGLGSSLM